MTACRNEITLSEALADPLVRALMKADRVNPERLETCLGAVGDRLRKRAAK